MTDVECQIQFQQRNKQMNDNEEAKKSKGGAIGAVIGTLVLAAACAVGK